MNLEVETYKPNQESVATPIPSITVTDEAASQVQTLLNDMEEEFEGLRIFVQGGGCSGFQYGFTFDEAVNDDDAVIEQNGIKFIVDELSYQYLVGAEIDYKSDLDGERFIIRNPNAVTTCGCGSSFAVADSAEESDQEN